MKEDNIFKLKPNHNKYDKIDQKGQKLTEKKHIQNVRTNLKKKIKNRLLK